MKMAKVEILAPAGNKEMLIAAVNAGADAVYIAGKRFGARGFALNFTKEEIIEAIYFAHLRGCLIYIVINTLIFDSEVSSVLEYADFLVSNNVDALIVSDLGMIDLFTRRYPDTEIHLSTQANVYSLEQVKVFERIGVKRIILARETSLDQIKKIKENSNIDLEVFVHGALCMSYSGLCLFSHVQCNRSGNRGLCAQNCRLKFQLIEDNKRIQNGYLLSTKDLMTLDYLSSFQDSVKSFKIEGRMRSSQYVIMAVKLYKKKLNNELINPLEYQKLAVTYNRDYTKGYLNNIENDSITNPYRSNHLGIKLAKVISYNNGLLTIYLYENLSINDGIRVVSDKGDFGKTITEIYLNNQKVRSALAKQIVVIPLKCSVNKNDIVLKTFDYELKKELDCYLNINYPLIGIKGTIKVIVGYEIELNLRYKEKNISINGPMSEESKNAPLSDLTIESHINKLKDTPFYFEDLKVINDGKSFVRISDLNLLRRKAIAFLSNLIIARKAKTIDKINNHKAGFIIDQKNLALKTDFLEISPKFINYNFNIQYLKEGKKGIPGLKHIYYKPVIRLDNAIYHSNDYLISDIGMSEFCQNFITDSTFNVTNIYTINFLGRLGAKRVTLSKEVPFSSISSIISNYQKTFAETPNLEVILYSKDLLMVLKHHLVRDYDQSKRYFLEDQNKNLFRVIKDHNSFLITSKEAVDNLNLLEEMYAIGVNTIRIEDDEL